MEFFEKKSLKIEVFFDDFGLFVNNAQNQA
jgi:hypothetical protein